MIKVGIIGGTGYTGVELLRLLSQHNGVKISIITARQEAGKSVDEFFPNLSTGLKFSSPTIENLTKCDVVFCATPNGVAMTFAEELLESGVKFIDLAADYRFDDATLWSKWYSGEKNMSHQTPDLLSEAVYGLCEMNRDKIKSAKLVGNPGCYPTAVSLGLMPFLTKNLIESETIIADCKSGVSGAGRTINITTLQAESAENFKAYAVGGHRHQPEIEHNLTKFVGKKISLTFMPHLVPMIRGIHATIYTKLTDNTIDAKKVLAGFYQNEFFVGVSDTAPETRWVRGSNFCKISVQQNDDQLIIFSVIDNLVKGAAGQAIQNMNIMFGLAENEGLKQVALMP